MEYRQLGHSNLWVSSLGMGCATFGREIDETTSFQILDHALERGINFFDTADSYGFGMSETVLGLWVSTRNIRDKVILATKVGSPTSEDSSDWGCSGKRIIAHIDASLKRLRADYVDLYMLHRWDPNVRLEESLEALDHVVKQGKARYIGCSNYMTWQLCRALWISDIHGWTQFQSVENAYSLVRPDIERELLPFCAQQGTGVISYSPLGAGFLTGKYRYGGPVPRGARFDVLPGHQNIYFNEARWRTLEGLRTKAGELGIPMSQLALAWVITQSAISSMLIGARRVEHIDNAFEAESMGMSPELRDELSALWPVPMTTDAALM